MASFIIGLIISAIEGLIEVLGVGEVALDVKETVASVADLAIFRPLKVHDNV